MIGNFEFATLIEEVELFDEFTNPKTGRNSKAFHVIFRFVIRELNSGVGTETIGWLGLGIMWGYIFQSGKKDPVCVGDAGSG